MTSRFGDDVTLLFGSDEMLLSGLVGGAHGAAGSTYNFFTREALEVLNTYRVVTCRGPVVHGQRSRGWFYL